MNQAERFQKLARIEADMQTTCDILCMSARIKSMIELRGEEKYFPELLRGCKEVIEEYTKRLAELEALLAEVAKKPTNDAAEDT